jgi:transaldolase
LTIAPNLLAQLDQDQQTVTAQLSNEAAQQAEKIERSAQSKESFKAELEHDLMAFQLLQSGIDGFIKARDQLSLLLRQSFGIDAEIKP